MVLLLALVLCLLIMGLPYMLYLDSQHLEQPVVIFRARRWRVLPIVAALFIFNTLALVVFGLLAIRPTSSLAASLGDFAMVLVCLSLGFVMLWQYGTYWQHDQHATLTIYRQEQRAEYRNENTFSSFALADVVQITEYTLKGNRGIYSYQIFTLRDGTELLLTCLMYSMLGPQELMPAALHQVVHCYFCWLPGKAPSLSNLF